jgi:hypothetical protein
VDPLDARPPYYQHSSADSSELDTTRQRNISPASYSANTVTRHAAIIYLIDVSQSALDLRMTRFILTPLSKRGAYVACAATMRTRQRRSAPDYFGFEAHYLCYYMSVGGVEE